MEVPILKHGSYLIATMQPELTDSDLIQMQDSLAAKVGQFRATAVIIDVTSLDIMDSFACRTMRDVAHMIRLRGADTVIVGIQPEVAFSMVQLGLTLEGIDTALDLEEGLETLDHKRRTRESRNRSRGK